MSKNHTPGPWMVEYLSASSFSIRSTTTKTLLVAVFSSHNDITPEERGNAAAMAAAPELLKALELVRAEFRINPCRDPFVAETVEKAIAKAVRS